MALVELSFGFQGYGVQERELFDENGRVGLIEKSFDQLNRLSGVFLFELGLDSGETLFLGQFHEDNHGGCPYQASPPAINRNQ